MNTYQWLFISSNSVKLQEIKNTFVFSDLYVQSLFKSFPYYEHTQNCFVPFWESCKILSGIYSSHC